MKNIKQLKQENMTNNNNFALYIAQFDENFTDIKAYNTTVIGEVNLQSEKYRGKTPEQACEQRLKEELSFNKNIGKNDNYLFDHIVRLSCISVYHNGKAGADKLVHKYLKETKGFSPNKSIKNRDTEFFDLGENGINVALDAVKEIFSPELLSKKPFIPRANQRDYIEKIINAHKNGHKKFLLGAICRFGKTASTLHVLYNELKYRHILVLSAKLDAQRAWLDDSRKFFGNDIVIITKNDLQNDKNILNKNKNKNILCFISLQSGAKNYNIDAEDILDAEDKETFKTWQNKIKNFNWDVVVADECHYAFDTKRSQNFIEKIKCDFYVDISATAFKKINRGEYNIDNSYIYGLYEEELDYKNGKIKKDDFIPVKVSHLSLLTLLQNNVLLDGKKCSKKVQEQLNKKILKIIENEKFSWSAYFEQFDSCSLAMHINMLFNKYFLINDNINTAIVVKEISHAKKLENVIDKTKYEVFNVAGNNKITLAVINRALKKARLGVGKPVIMISCGRFLTASTLKYLDSIVYMCKVNSAENYIQYGLRPKNKYENRKTSCNIFDLNTESFIQTDAFKLLVDIEAKYKKTTCEKIIKQYQDCMELWELDDTYELKKYNNFSDEFQKNIYHLNNGKLNLENIITFDLIATNNNDILLDIQNLENKRKRNDYKSGMTITDTGIGNAGIDDTSKTDKTNSNISKDDNKKDNKISTLKQCQILLDTLKDKINKVPGFMAYNKIKNFEQLFLSTEYNEKMYYFCGGLTIKLFLKIKKILINNNLENSWNELINRINLNAIEITKKLFN